MSAKPGDFVVLKFGGTSVSSAANWHNIREVLRARLAAGFKPVVVHSALSGITDKLEGLLDQALAGGRAALLAAIKVRHAELARELGLELPPTLRRAFSELTSLSAQISSAGEIRDLLRARVLAAGELMATHLGAAWLASQGLDVEWLDAREILHAEERRGATAKAAVLSTTCDFAPDLALQARCARPGTVFLTQGFIASDAR